MIILILHITCLLLLAFRIMLFGSRGSRRPIIAGLAYALMIAAFSEAVRVIFGMTPAPSKLSLMLEIAFTLAVFCHKGNVAELFKPKGCTSKLSKLLCWSPKNKKATP